MDKKRPLHVSVMQSRWRCCTLLRRDIFTVYLIFIISCFLVLPPHPPPPKKKAKTKSRIKLAILISRIIILKNHDSRWLAKSRFTRKTKAISHFTGNERGNSWFTKVPLNQPPAKVGSEFLIWMFFYELRNVLFSLFHISKRYPFLKNKALRLPNRDWILLHWP